MLFYNLSVGILLMIRYVLLLLAVYCIPATIYAQRPDSLANKLDSLKRQTDNGRQQNLIEPEFYNEKTKITPGIFGILLLDDFKQQALSPFKPTKKTLIRDGIILGATIGILFLDKPIQRWAVTFRSSNPWSVKPSKTLSDLGGAFEVIPLAVIATTGFVFKNEKLRTTTALAIQSYVTSTVWSALLKQVFGRTRPDSYDPNSGLNDSRFHGPFFRSTNHETNSFPSGHATVAFAAATVYAKEYKDIPMVPVLSYGVATLVSLSRITENRHWATDLIAGGLLGFACGTQVVNNYHRYARLKRQGGFRKKPGSKGGVTFKIEYSQFGILQSGIVYTFKN